MPELSTCPPMDPGGKGLTLLPNGRQRIGLPRTPREWVSFVQRWVLADRLAIRLAVLGAWATDNIGSDLWIISGYRTCEEQTDLARRERDNPQGTVVAPCSTSCHVVCPSLAADLGTDFSLPENLKVILGQKAGEIGLRWGGTFREPSPNHYDLGPCS